MPESILRTADVMARVRLGRTTLWRLERLGDFPPRRRLGAGIVGWLASEVEHWIESRPLANANDCDDAAEPPAKIGT